MRFHYVCSSPLFLLSISGITICSQLPTLKNLATKQIAQDIMNGSSLGRYGNNFTEIHKTLTQLLPTELYLQIQERIQLELGWQNPQQITLNGHTNEVLSVAISPDNQFIVTGSRDHTAKIWDAKSGNLLQTLAGLNGHTQPITSVAISPDNQFIVTGSWDHTAKIWDAKSGNLLHTLAGPNGHVHGIASVAISSNNQFIVTGSWDRTAKIWNPLSLALFYILWLAPMAIHHWVNSVAISPDNQFIVTGAHDCTAKIWDAETGNLLHTLAGPNGHTKGSRFQLQYHLIINLLLQDQRTSQQKFGMQNRVTFFHTLDGPNGHTSVISSIAISSDNQFIVTGSQDNTAKIWDA